MKKILVALALFIFLSADLFAQGCVTCTQTAAGLGSSSAQGLNTGIVYLAALPLIFMITIGYIWWKRTRTTAEEPNN